MSKTTPTPAEQAEASALAGVGILAAGIARQAVGMATNNPALIEQGIELRVTGLQQAAGPEGEPAPELQIEDLSQVIQSGLEQGVTP